MASTASDSMPTRTTNHVPVGSWFRLSPEEDDAASYVDLDTELRVMLANDPAPHRTCGEGTAESVRKA